MSRPRPQILLLPVAAAFVILSNLTPITESDFWLQLKVGDEIRRTGTIPPTIEYAFTEACDRPFVAHEWLPSIVTSALFGVAGYSGMILFKCALATGVVSLGYALARRCGADSPSAIAIALSGATTMNFRFQMRPEIFALLFAFAAVYVLTVFLNTRRRWWLAALGPLALIWANAHASILIGILLPWMFLAGAAIDDWRAGRPWRRDVHVPLALSGLAMAVLATVNPYGLRLLTHAVAFGRATYLRANIVEFAATFGPATRDAPYFWVYLAYAACLLVVLIHGRRFLDGTAIVLLAVFGWMSIDAIRFTAWFALAGTYAMGRALSRSIPAARARRIARTTAAAALVGILIVLIHGDVRGHRVGFRREGPMSQAALDFVRDHGIRGSVFNTFSHGDQLIWAFYPAIRVVIDSRIDAYGEAYYLRYRDLCGRSYKALGPPSDLIAFLDRYGVATIVTRPLDFRNWVGKGHVAALESRGFAVIYADPTTVILRRNPRLPAASAIGDPDVSAGS